MIGGQPLTEVAWLGPYPGGPAAGPAAPGARYEQREAVELAFVAAMQHLAGNQRAALLLIEVLGFSAFEVAVMMNTSITSVHSALARARRIVAEKVPATSQQQTLRKIGDARLREVVADFSTALERGDADALIVLLTEDVTWSMPPLPHWYSGLDAVMDFARELPLSRCGSWRHLPTHANGQAAVASYLWNGQEHAAWSINVLTLRDERIADITAFVNADVFLLFGLPARLP
jgi:RNA polymerase sigma-70 factor (ECF subfamily)